MIRRRPLPLLLAVVALAGGAVGCGDDTPTTTSAEPTATVPTTSAVPPAVAESQGERGTGTGSAAPADGSAAAAAPPGASVEGGRAAPPATARAVRGAFRAFARAIADRDAQALCARTVGFEELLRTQGGGGGSCEKLFANVGNGAAGPSKRDLRMIDDADVVVRGDRATLSLAAQTPVPMRRVRGAWKVDYAAFAAPTPDPKD